MKRKTPILALPAALAVLALACAPAALGAEVAAPGAGGTAAPSATTTPTVTTGGIRAVPLTATTPTGPRQVIVGIPVTHRSARAGGVSTGAILAAVLGGLLVLACLAWAILRMRAVEPRWLLSLRHSVAEAGYRGSLTWSEFADWLRLGH